MQCISHTVDGSIHTKSSTLQYGLLDQANISRRQVPTIWAGVVGTLRLWHWRGCVLTQFGQEHLCVVCEQIQSLGLVRKSNNCTNPVDIIKRGHFAIDGPTGACNPYFLWQIVLNNLEKIGIDGWISYNYLTTTTYNSCLTHGLHFTDLFKKFHSLLGKSKDHDNCDFGVIDILDDVFNHWYSITVYWNQPLICHTDRLCWCRFREFLHTLLSIFLVAAHHSHPVPPKLLKQFQHGLYLPLVTGHRTKEWWVEAFITELVAAGPKANLRWKGY